MNRILHSIPLKICFTIFITEALFLSLMGIYYINKFWKEIDSNIATKLELPGLLMEQRALNFEAVMDYKVLEEIVQEEVLDAFIAKRDGSIFYSQDPSRTGKDYTLFLAQKEMAKIRPQAPATLRKSSLLSGNGGDSYWSILSPLEINGRFLGMLYIKIDSATIQKKKQEIVILFLIGSLLAIILTTILEALLLHRIFVPRINATSATLKKVGEGDLTARVKQRGESDQLGLLIDQVNSMLEKVEQHTDNLHLLNKAGEAFSETRGMEEIEKVSIEILEEYVDQSCTAEEKTQFHKIVNYSLGKNSLERNLLELINKKTKHRPDNDTTGFIQALARLISNALSREMLLLNTQKAEQQYRDLFTSALEGIFKATTNGKILIANPSLFKMFGYDSSIELASLPDDIIQHHYVNPDDRDFLLEAIEREGKFSDQEIQFHRKDGSIFWASVSAHGVEDKTGCIEAVEGRIIDISERKKREKAEREKEVAEATSEAQVELLDILEKNNEKLKKTLVELKQAQKQIVQSEKMTAVGMTASGVAHDLNNILSGVIGYPELLLMKIPEDSEFRKPLELIMAAGKRAAAVVADLLTLSRDVARTKEVVSLNALIEEYFNSVEFEQIKATFPNIHVSTRLNKDLLSISCSTTHIQKVIMNLLINAFEALKSGGNIFVTTENRIISNENYHSLGLAPGDYVLMNVIDDGPGINDEDLNFVFEPFYTKKIMGQSGTGLGLTVVRNAVEEHGGTVTVTSTNKGTVFSVYLPSTREEDTQQADQTVLEHIIGKGTILIVDDEELQRDVASKMLAQLGYSVDAVCSGEEALQYLQNRAVDLVLLDMLMPPGINGRETYERIIDLYPEQRAILVSGFSENKDVRKAIELGVNGFLKKPYTLDQLGKAVLDGLNSHDKRQEGLES